MYSTFSLMYFSFESMRNEIITLDMFFYRMTPDCEMKMYIFLDMAAWYFCGFFQYKISECHISQ